MPHNLSEQTDAEALWQLRRAYEERERWKREVEAWLADKSQAGELALYGDAPMWRDYYDANLRLGEVVRVLGERGEVNDEITE